MKHLSDELKIPEDLQRCVNQHRVVCLVTEDWLRGVQKGQFEAIVNNLTISEVDLYIAKSVLNIPPPWVRKSIKCIEKQDVLIASDSHVQNKQECLTDSFTELHAYIGEQNRKNLWREVQKKHNKYINNGGLPSSPSCDIKHRKFNDVLREALQMLYRCDIVQLYPTSASLLTPDLSNSSSNDGHNHPHPNTVPVDCIIETDSVFYVIEEYFPHNVNDVVTFSPAILGESHSKPLFLVYQLLSLTSWLHSQGLALGDIRLSNILLDSKLWMHIPLPNIEAILTNEIKPCDQNKTDVILKNDLNPSAKENELEGITSDLGRYTHEWVHGRISNFDYLMILNKFAGRRYGDPNNHPVIPWVCDFTQPNGGFRNFNKSKYRLNKGDRQLDLTYDIGMMDLGSGSTHTPHHISDVLADITYYVYKARVTPKEILCKYVRSKWVANEYPSSMQRLQEWTPDECIPEFFTDPTIFTSIHEDLPDLEIPTWCDSPEDFIKRHMEILESEPVSSKLHHWIDLTFGYKLGGASAVRAKNVCLQLVNQHKDLSNHGVVQLFTQPHPHRHTKKPRESAQSYHLPTVGSFTTISLNSHSVSNINHGDPIGVSNVNGVNKTKETTGGIVTLPKDWKPLAELEQLESEYKFSLRTNLELPNQEQLEDPQTDLRDIRESRDMQVIGCVMAEMFFAPKLRGMSQDAPLEHRYRVVCKHLRKDFSDVPRPFRCALKWLLQLDKDNAASHTIDGPSATGLLFNYEPVSNHGLPPPTPRLLLHPLVSILPFPAYFPDLYTLFSQLHVYDIQLAALDGLPGEVANVKALAKEKVICAAKGLIELLPKLNQESVELIMPFIMKLFTDKFTTIQAMWSLFGPISQSLGPKMTSKMLLPVFADIFNADPTSPKHIKLYHRSFLLQAIIRLGLNTFLTNFSTSLVEATAGYKNFTLAANEQYERLESADLNIRNSSINQPDINSSDDIDKDETNDDIIDVDDPLEKSGEVFNMDNIDGDTDSSTKPDHSSSDSCSVGKVSIDRLESDIIEDAEREDDVSIEEECGDEPTDEALGKSLGLTSVHSLSRLMDRQRTASVGSSEVEDPLGNSSSDVATPRPSETDSSDTGIPQRMPRSETEEFYQSLGTMEYNISDVAMESVMWLAHRLGPVLATKYLSRNLLRMLGLCYLGQEQMQCTNITTDDGGVSCSKKEVSGDVHVANVLKCLTGIAVLYGEHVILLQYFPHIVDVIASSTKRLTVRAEGGLIGCAALIHYLVPYLTDTTLMDNLKGPIFEDMLAPLLKLASSQQHSFPSGAIARTVICYKVLDILYIIGLRISFEMTRKFMSPILKLFFASFERVHVEMASEGQDPGTKLRQNKSSSSLLDSTDENMYCQIKKDSYTQEYKIGTPVKVDWMMASTSSQSSFRYSLSPPIAEDRELDSVDVVADSGRIKEELSECFTPELAHIAYIPFCKLAGGIHMEATLTNDNLIRQLVALHDEALTKQAENDSSEVKEEGEKKDPNNVLHEGGLLPAPGQTSWFVQLPSQDADVAEATEDVGTFGSSIQGNRLVLDVDPEPDASVNVSNKKKPPDPLSKIDYTRLKCPDMVMNKRRHLKGNWLAYWEHELGLSERETLFNFKQIKLQTYSGHTNSIRAIYPLDNENSFITASKDKTVKLWSLRNSGGGGERGGCQWTYNLHKKSVFSVTFLEPLRLAASCDSIVHIWDPYTGRCIRQLESAKNSPVTVLTPMPAPSTTLITATTDATLRFLDVRTGSYMHEFKCTTGAAGLIRCVTVSPDSNIIAVGYSSGIISMLDARTGELLRTWKGHEGEILQIKAFNNNLFVTSSFDQAMSLWNIDDGKLVCHFRGHSEPAHCFSFYRNEIISATTGNRIGVHTSLDGQASFSSTKLRSDTFKGVLTTLAVLPLNRLLLLGADNGTIKLLC
ncbi:unnamed protein product [Owenia fusiformis]|uniref:BEACH domain-containing protein n=1 Tax=Owenia fusiformis TaxID=6347 RepID=A0A8S4PBG4_OWEFU|nr:unnamed protein product [Owenia fusiformis]